MAEVSDLHLPDEDDDGEVVDEVETLDSSSVPYWSNDFDHEEFYVSDSDPFFPQFSEFVQSDHSLHSSILAYADQDEDINGHHSCFQIADADGSDSDSVTHLNYFNPEDQVNFVMNLFERRLEGSHVTDNNNSSASDSFSETLINESSFGVLEARNREMNADYVELGLGLGVTAHRQEAENSGFMIGDFFVRRQGSGSESGESSTVHAAEPFVEGLRVVRIGSDSDEEEEEDGGLRIEVHSGNDDGMDRSRDDLGLPFCWDCLRLEDQRDANEDFEWEEVDERVGEREVLSMVIDADEERSVSTDIRSEREEESGEGVEESIRNLEWEVLLAVNNLERNTDFEHETESYHEFHDTESLFADEYEMFFGQFTETESALKLGPPAAKSVVENLPSIFLTQDDVKNNNVLCAVCKDEISIEEEAKRLPCSHHYHGDCIIPWLNIRNTCPVCRFELTTDDPDYEQRRTRRASLRLQLDSQVRRRFDILPEQ